MRKYIFLGLALVVLIALVAVGKTPVGYNEKYQPVQPLAYDHSVHAGENKIDCLYCHVGAERGRHAVVPSLNICMNCHVNLKKMDPEIDKLKDAHLNGKNIEWIKIHMLPDFVMFNHERHMKAKRETKIKCQDCHGPIETMRRVYQYSDLSMGWCIDCHRKPENNAPIDCSTCHY